MDGRRKREAEFRAARLSCSPRNPLPGIPSRAHKKSRSMWLRTVREVISVSARWRRGHSWQVPIAARQAITPTRVCPMMLASSKSKAKKAFPPSPLIPPAQKPAEKKIEPSSPPPITPTPSKLKFCAEILLFRLVSDVLVAPLPNDPRDAVLQLLSAPPNKNFLSKQLKVIKYYFGNDKRSTSCLQ